MTRSIIVGTKKNNYWMLGSVNIFPHLKSDKLYTYTELISKAQNIIYQMNSTFPEYNMSLYPKDNVYCCEVNGKWCVVLFIAIKGYLYHYMLRRDKELNATFGCPLVNVEYVGEKNLRNKIFCENNMINHKELWNTFEKLVMISINSNKKITAFES